MKSYNVTNEDAYFKRGWSALKVGQTLVAILAWLVLLFPFIWVGLSLYFKMLPPEMLYMETSLIRFLSLFFFSVILLLTLSYIILTKLNNRDFRRIYERKNAFNEAEVERKKRLLKSYYDQKFGDRETRYKVRYYLVKEEQNIATDEIKKLYQNDEDKAYD